MPVKTIGNDIFLTDGHSRALAAALKGHEFISVEDDLDWIAHVENPSWCRAAGITTVRDLESRIVDETDHASLCPERCQAARDRIERDPLWGLAIHEESDSELKAAYCSEVL